MVKLENTPTLLIIRIEPIAIFFVLQSVAVDSIVTPITEHARVYSRSLRHLVGCVPKTQTIVFDLS